MVGVSGLTLAVIIHLERVSITSDSLRGWRQNDVMFWCYVWIFCKNLFLKFINKWKPNITVEFLDIFILEGEFFYDSTRFHSWVVYHWKDQHFSYVLTLKLAATIRDPENYWTFSWLILTCVVVWYTSMQLPVINGWNKQWTKVLRLSEHFGALVVSYSKWQNVQYSLNIGVISATFLFPISSINLSCLYIIPLYSNGV